MSILLERQPELPLQQGDVLADIETYYSDYTGGSDDRTATEGEGSVLVLSRPCKAIRSDLILVAPIVAKQLDGVMDEQSFDDLKEFFEGIRDGLSEADTFYLGNLGPDEKKRYAAKLDRIRTIKIPVDAEARRAFSGTHRSHRLNPEFQRDLHLRIFRSFASLGFDDEEWWPDEDLRLIVNSGKARIAALEAEVAKNLDERGRLEVGGVKEKRLNACDEATKGSRERLEALRKQVGPLSEELERRSKKPTAKT